ncbi:MAG: class I SAM-dependent methyltransferase [Candidatus Tyrphobacter sp.]
MPAHPLAEALATRLAPGARVLDFGSGTGRNTDALRALGFHVVAMSDEDARDAAALTSAGGPFDAAIVTHALLHGTPQTIARRIDALASVLRAEGPFHAVFASTKDRRYGVGTQTAAYTFAAESGDEAGVPHVFYEETRLRAILAAYFEIESLEQCAADAIAGGWAHPTTPLRNAVHWFLRAKRR